MALRWVLVAPVCMCPGVTFVIYHFKALPYVSSHLIILIYQMEKKKQTG